MSPDNPSPEPDVIPGSDPVESMDTFSSDEVDQLISRKETAKIVEGVTKLFSYSGDPIKGNLAVRSFDFTNPSFLSEKEINQVKSRNEKFAFYLGQTLSMELRMNMDFSVKNLAVQQYSDYTQSIASPSHVSLFKIKEISGVGLLEIGATLALAMVDRSLGGRGVAVKEPRLLTAIESTMVDDICQLIVDEWTHQWKDYIKLTGQIIGQETTGRFLQTSSPDSAILVLTLEATLGEVKEDLRIGIPYYSITPILTKIQEITKKAEKSSSTPDSYSWRSSYNDISVKASSEWNVKTTTVQDILSLEPGDFLQLSPSIVNHTFLRIAGKDCFVGEFGKNEEGVALKITKKLN